MITLYLFLTLEPW